MTPLQRQVLCENTARSMGDVDRHIKKRHVDNCAKADPGCGEGVVRALGLLRSDAAE